MLATALPLGDFVFGLLKCPNKGCSDSTGYYKPHAPTGATAEGEHGKQHKVILCASCQRHFLFPYPQS